MVYQNAMVFGPDFRFHKGGFAVQNARFSRVLAVEEGEGIDLGGAYVVPGFIDVHNHGIRIARSGTRLIQSSMKDGCRDNAPHDMLRRARASHLPQHSAAGAEAFATLRAPVLVSAKSPQRSAA